MKVWSVYVLLSFFLISGCVWQPVIYDDKRQAAVGATVEAFAGNEALEPFFRDAVAYAVFPSAVRAGTGFGGAYGMGWLFEGEEVTGKVSLFEFFAGVDLGAQVYRSMLFFRTQASVELFKRGRFEFTGQTNAAVLTLGGGLTPSFNQEVALFTQLRTGLMLEASVGTQRYDFYPLIGDGHE